MKNATKIFLSILVVLVLVFIISEFVYKRFDLTQDKRYTISAASEKLIKEIKNPLNFEIVLDGEMPGNYRNLKNEIRFMLDEFKTLNSKIKYEFVDPKTINIDHLNPVRLPTQNGTLNIFPYAFVRSETKSDTINFISRVAAQPQKDWPISSIDKLEYSLVNGIRNVTREKKKSIAFTMNHGELANRSIYIASFLKSLQENYNVVAYDTDSSFTAKSLDDLKNFDALIVAKPTIPFSDEDKLVLDQYVMNGGKTLWMTETVDAEMDSIWRSGKIVAFPRDLKLNEFFFNYGIRIIPGIVKDLNARSIILADGEISGNISYNSYTWPYFVVGTKADFSPITETLGPVRFEFANTFELLENPNVKQTVLLATYSDKTAIQPSMSFIDLNEVGFIQEQLPEYFEEYNQFNTRLPLAVLLEGNFESAYAARYERNEFPQFKASTTEGKMIVVADGDVTKNHIRRGHPMDLGEDWFAVRPDNPQPPAYKYDNLNFLLNCVDYLLGETDFLNLKNRKLEIPLLNESKVQLDRSKWQIINLLIPLVLIGIIGFIGVFSRRKKYASA